jgi:ABC-2 type transport system permease protein
MNALRRWANYIRSMEAPVLVQEMRTSQRGWQPFAVTLVYLLVLIAALLIYGGIAVSEGMFTPQRASEHGRVFVLMLSMVQLVMIMLLAPAYSASEVCQERDRRTLDLLSLTLLSSSTIIAQKLAVAAGRILMLQAVSLPVLSIVFMVGGVSPSQVAVVYGLVAASTLMLGALGLLCSCLLPNTRTSTAAAYLGTWIPMLGLPAFIAWYDDISSAGNYASMTEYPLMFALAFLVVGGIVSFAVYGFLAFFLRGRGGAWSSRAFRMAVYGAIYVGVLLIDRVPGVTDAMLASGYGRDAPLIIQINPIWVMGDYLDPYNASRTWPWVMSLSLCISLAFLFAYLSKLKLEALRRAP